MRHQYTLLVVLLALAGSLPILAESGIIEMEFREDHSFAKLADAPDEVTITGHLNRDWSDRFSDGRVQLPFGHYSFRVHLKGFRTWKRRVHVRSEYELVSVPLSLANYSHCAPRDCEAWTFSGRVEGRDLAGERIWIHLDPISDAGEPQDQLLDPTRRFRFEGVSFEYYLLSVFAFDANAELDEVRIPRRGASTKTRFLKLLHSQLVRPNQWRESGKDVVIRLK